MGSSLCPRSTRTASRIAAAAFGIVELDLSQVLTGSPATVGGTTPAATSRDLEGLEVSPPGSMAGYSREKFAHWSDADDFGWTGLPDASCDVRDAALIRDGEEVKVGEGCDVLSGRWR